MTIVVTGASGLVGGRLLAALRGHSVRILGRREPAGMTESTRFYEWDASTEPPREALSGADTIIHLAGEPVGQRWTAEVKRRIRDSRVSGTRNLVSAIRAASPRPAALICASAIGYYGDRKEEVLVETSPPGQGFLADTCRDWEEAAVAAQTLGVRTVLLRIGLVLDRNGGALKEMMRPFQMGVGGPVGSGKQWVSWIHVSDLISLIECALNNQSLAGPVNATAPNSVRNGDFARQLGKALGRPSVVPVPAFALKLALGEMAQLALCSQRVLPRAAVAAGFRYRFADIASAFDDLFGPAPVSNKAGASG